MKRKRLIQSAAVIAVALVSSGCASADKRKQAAASHADQCLAVGQHISSARACLAGKGFTGARKNLEQGEDVLQKCGPYWGWPLVRSCGGVMLTFKQGAVVSWRAWGELDGV